MIKSKYGKCWADLFVQNSRNYGYVLTSENVFVGTFFNFDHTSCFVFSKNISRATTQSLTPTTTSAVQGQ